MSEDIVVRLRFVPSIIRTEAAATIEALRGEVERLGNLAANYEHEMKMAEAEAARLRQELDGVLKMIGEVP